MSKNQWNNHNWWYNQRTFSSCRKISCSRNKNNNRQEIPSIDDEIKTKSKYLERLNKLWN
ncbi:MAG: hypothetical protein K2I36_01835 [Ureaplasma sp.]|nr:hypothetical protein [Ureaplasma sp.]MDE7221886.1 hypothetical protein [Ureaplasma sp.]